MPMALQDQHCDASGVVSFPAYADFAAHLQATNILSDAWIAGEPRFRLQGMVLSPAQARRSDSLQNGLRQCIRNSSRWCGSIPSGWRRFFI